MRESFSYTYNPPMTLTDFTWAGMLPLLSVLTIIGQLAGLIVLCAIAIGLMTGRRTLVERFVQNNGLILMLIVALTATLSSLYFSEVAGWSPCKYCWIQRIFMYPQVILLAIALWKRDRTVARSIVALSLIGLAYAAYHYYIQMYDIIASSSNPATPCDASGESCVKTPFVQFGYITIPMMALTAFLLNLIGSLVVLRRSA